MEEERTAKKLASECLEEPGRHQSGIRSFEESKKRRKRCRPNYSQERNKRENRGGVSERLKETAGGSEDAGYTDQRVLTTVNAFMNDERASERLASKINGKENEREKTERFGLAVILNYSNGLVTTIPSKSGRTRTFRNGRFKNARRNKRLLELRRRVRYVEANDVVDENDLLIKGTLIMFLRVE